MASSTRLSFSPMRRSPVMILMMYLASSGVSLREQFADKSGFGGRARGRSDLSKCRFALLGHSDRNHWRGLNPRRLARCRALLGLDRRGRPSPHDLQVELPRPPRPGLRVCDRRRSVPPRFSRKVLRPLATAAFLLLAAWSPPRLEKVCRKEKPRRRRLPRRGLDLR